MHTSENRTRNEMYVNVICFNIHVYTFAYICLMSFFRVHLRYISISRSLKCMTLNNRVPPNVHLSLNVLKMYSKCNPNVHLTQFSNNNNRKNRYLFQIGIAQMYANVHKCTFAYIYIHFFNKKDPVCEMYI